MTKKNLLIGLSAMAVLLIIGSYWIGFLNPDSFPHPEELVKEINHHLPQAEAKIIQDTIKIEDRRVFVPFISEKNKYGVSLWIWKGNDWEIAAVNTRGEPRSWQLENEDSPTTYIMWNISPDLPIKKIKLFLKKDRSFHITEGVEYYDPGIQMEKTFELGNTSYGVMSLPDEWTSILESYMALEETRQPDIYSSNFFIEHYMYLGWIAYDESDLVLPPQNDLVGGGFSSGNEYITHVRLLDPLEIETYEYPVLY